MKIYQPTNQPTNSNLALIALLLAAGLGYTSSATAALMSRLGGQAVYDTDFNITWLADANANGAMTWADANTWAAGLNVGGYTGWRLPNADISCGAGVGAYNCINSELGHLYYTELGATQDNSINNSTSPYMALFTNVQNVAYWSGNGYAPNPLQAWVFYTQSGFQYQGNKLNEWNAWAVRSGDVGGGGSVPEPGILGLMSIGALAWAGIRSRRLG